jgi:hypothetical protein
VKRALVAVVFALLGVAGIAVPASAAPAATLAVEYCNGTSGCVAVDVSFSNRSASVAGSVFDDRNAGSTTAVFQFYTANGYWSEQTRTANNERRPIGFSEPGPAGGINYVEVYLVSNATGAWTYMTSFSK